jgi:hypothetical protein
MNNPTFTEVRAFEINDYAIVGGLAAADAIKPIGDLYNDGLLTIVGWLHFAMPAIEAACLDMTGRI